MAERSVAAMNATSTSATTLTELKVGAAMHPGIFNAPADARLATVAAIMATRQIHAVALGGSAQTRLFTDFDLLAAALAGAEHAGMVTSTRLVPALTPDDALDVAIRALADKNATHAVVCDANRVPIGVLAAIDVVAIVGGRDPRLAGQPRPGPARPAHSERRLDHVRVADVMHRGVITVAPATTLRDLAARLADQHIHCAVVSGIKPAKGGESLVWAIADTLDIVRAVAGGRIDTTAGELAGSTPLCINESELLASAAAELVAHDVGHAVVLDRDDRPVGVVSTLDIAGVLAIA